MFQHGSIGPPICHLTPRLSSKLAGQLQKYAAKLACGSTCQVLILPSPIHRLKPRPQRKTPCNYAPKAYFQEKISLSHPSLILSPKYLFRRLEFLIELIDCHPNLPIQEVPATLLRHRHKRSIRATSQRQTQSCSLFTDSLDIL